ncbi:hypothetical protein LJC31_06845 [Synergistaceae bacterium OttesenSCG-928-I11]|nr:hypothetical protein [Synergistaceae bacterium OttesenSCG-928-I11]
MAGMADVGRRRCAVFALVFFLAQAFGLIGSPDGWLAFAPGSAEAAEKWTGGMASGFAGGSGTETDPYRIASADQLAYLAKLVNKSDDKYVTKHYKLTADIDLGSDLAHQWTPIGGDSSPFKGTFDGDGHVVTGMRIVSDDYTYKQAGLFGFVNDTNAAIENVSVEDFVVSVDKKTAYIDAGGLVGHFNGETIHRAHANGIVYSSSSQNASNAGGLVGNFSGTLTSSSASGAVSSSSSFFSNAGGLVGYFSGTLTSSSASGAVSSSSSSSNAGGLVGNFSGTLTSSSASGAVFSSSSVQPNAGGLVGNFSGTLTTSYASGAVSSYSSSVTYNAITGGLVGRFSGTLTTSHASGVVLSSAVSGVSGGGLVGMSGGNIIDTYATGFVEAIAGDKTKALIGGLAGYLSGIPAKIKTSYTWGAVSADTEVVSGGLVGQVGESVRAENILSNDWRRDASTGVNATLNVGIGSDDANPAVEQTTHAKSLDVSQFGVASRDHFETAQGWDFINTWCYTSLDNGARPHLLAFFDPSDTSLISPDFVRLTPNAVRISAGETKYVHLIAAGWEKSADLAFTPSTFNGVTISQHGTSPDVIVISADDTLYSDSTEVSVDFKVVGYQQKKKGFVLKVIGDDYASADILAISADIGGTAYEWQRQNDGTTWALSGLPYDADLSAVDLNVSVYPGASHTNTKGANLNGNFDITVTAPDGGTTRTYTVVTSRETPPVIPTKIVDDDPSHAAASLDERADGTYGVNILVRFDDSFDHPSKIDTAYVDAVSMSITALRWIDDELSSRDITVRAASQYALNMTGTAPDEAALVDATLTKLTVRKYNDTATYTQTLDMKLSDIPGGKPGAPYVPPISPDFPGGDGVGCATGAGIAVFFALLALAALRRKK